MMMRSSLRWRRMWRLVGHSWTTLLYIRIIIVLVSFSFALQLCCIIAIALSLYYAHLAHHSAQLLQKGRSCRAEMQPKIDINFRPCPSR